VASRNSVIFETLRKHGIPDCDKNNFGYMVIEVQDCGKLLTTKEIKDIMSPPNMTTIQDQSLLKFNLANVRIIAQAINGFMYAESTRETGTCFCLAVPVSVPLNPRIVQYNILNPLNT